GARGAPITELADVLLTTAPVGDEWTSYVAGRASDSLAASVLWVLVAQRVPNSLEAMQADRSIPRELRDPAAAPSD
ncbi:MAG TPA: hypothetical protein VN241_02225, partial [Microbacterium sp.]|nr:hypothetical protein [Microbacterium sp.]